MVHGVVAAGHPVTADAAGRMLDAGGNAFDAALAAMLASFVAEPVLASLGGGGFLMARPAGGEPEVFDFFVQTPLRRRPLAEVELYPILADFGTAQQEFHIGMGTIATPGVPAGIETMHHALCRMPLPLIAEPAIAAARDGIIVNAFQHYIATVVAPILQSRSGALRLHATDENPDRLAIEGERIRNPDLAETLDALSREGAAFFYQDEPGQGLARDCRDLGGCLDMEDLARYRVERRRPLHRRYGDHQAFFNPPPSIGGTLLAFTLALLDSTGVPSGEPTLTMIARAMAKTRQVRLGQRVDYGLDDSAARLLLGDDLIARYRDALGSAVNTRGTTHISVADREGNMAALTLSNGEGSGYVAPGTGVMFNNMLGEEDLNVRGFHQWTPNRRVASMMSPSLLRSVEGDWFATGSGGSNRIRSAVLQVAINLLDRGLAIAQATDAPRIHLEGDELHVEAGFDKAELGALFAVFPRHHLWPEANLYFGGAHTVAHRRDGRLDGAGDPRRGGVTRQA